MDRPAAATESERLPRSTMRTFRGERLSRRASLERSLPETGYLGDDESSEWVHVVRVPQDAAGDATYPRAFEALRRALLPSSEADDTLANVNANAQQKLAAAAPRARRTPNRRRRRRRNRNPGTTPYVSANPTNRDISVLHRRGLTTVDA